MAKLNTTNQLIREFERVLAFRAGETVYCRFTREAFTVRSSNGCVATLNDGSTRIVGELTRIGG